MERTGQARWEACGCFLEVGVRMPRDPGQRWRLPSHAEGQCGDVGGHGRRGWHSSASTRRSRSLDPGQSREASATVGMSGNRSREPVYSGCTRALSWVMGPGHRPEACRRLGKRLTAAVPGF